MQGWAPKVGFCQAKPMPSFGKAADFPSEGMTL